MRGVSIVMRGVSIDAVCGAIDIRGVSTVHAVGGAVDIRGPSIEITGGVSVDALSRAESVTMCIHTVGWAMYIRGPSAVNVARPPGGVSRHGEGVSVYAVGGAEPDCGSAAGAPGAEGCVASRW